MYSRPSNQKGFTLVELLIVIALLGVLATAVLAAINPLEQANRARDARMKSDASQLLSAIDRYYVAIGHFPWYDGTTYTDDTAVDFITASNPIIGICPTGGSSCSTGTVYGSLITSNELKTEFRGRDFIKATAAIDMLYIAKENSASSGVAASVYACWIPKSKSERQKATRVQGAGGTVTTSATCASATYADLAHSCLSCLPD